MTEDCIFCGIVRNETDTELLYQDDIVVVFRDINPHAPVHLLLVPRKHIRSINDITEAEGSILNHLIYTARDMARKEGVDESGYKLLYNVEWGGGQRIFHLHMHLLGGWPKK